MPIQRHFIDWNTPILPAAADYLIDRYATSRQLDLSGVVVVFTGRRASRRMLELLFEKAAQRWPSFLPPRLTTFRHFPEMLYRQQHQWADDLSQLLIWKKALSSVPANELRAALPTVPDDSAVPSWMSLCESLRTQHNELAEDGMEFDRVFEKLSEVGNHQEADRWKALRRIQSEYLVQLDDLELWDRQASRLIAVEKQECEVDFDVVLLGTVDMNLIVKQMLNQVADRVTALVHAPASEAKRFDEYGCLIAEEWTDWKLNISPEETRIADDPEHQAKVVAQEMAEFGGARRPDEISIGVADESLVPLIKQHLKDGGVSGRWPVEMKLTETRPWRLLSAVESHLSSAADGQPPDFASLADLVRHPDVSRQVDYDVKQAMKTRRKVHIDWLTELDNYMAKHLQKSPGVLLGTKRRREIVGAVIGSVDRLLTSLCPHEVAPAPKKKRPVEPLQRHLLFDGDDDVEIVSQSVHHQLNSQRSLRDWTNGILRLLATVYESADLHADVRKDRGIAACCHAVADLATQLGEIPDRIVPRCTASQAVQLVLKQIGDVVIPPEGDDSAIDMMGWLELAMDDSPVLVLTGFNEGFVPESLTSDVFLPNSFRTRLGLRDNKRRYARDAYAITTMMHSREKLVFVAGRRDAKGNPLLPSRLWFAADAETLPDRVQRFYDEESVEPASVPSSVAEVPQQNQRLSDFSVPRPSLIPPTPTEISVTSFREYLYCPYRYFLKRELRLKSIEDETLELEAAAFGSLMHDVLKKFGQSDLVRSYRPEPIEEYLLKTLASVANRRFGKTRSATVAVQLQMMQNRLAAFASWQASTARDGWMVRYTEEDLRFDDFVDAKGRSVTLAGRVDRIDQHQKTGQYRVLDYKTSERADRPEATHVKKNEWVDLQLPLYRLLVQSLGIQSNVQLGYVHLSGDLSAIRESIAKWDRHELDAAEQTARQVAANIVDLEIDRVAPGKERRFTEFSRVCQDTVIDRNLPWLNSWTGRAS